jgi:hypothetical protein
MDCPTIEPHPHRVKRTIFCDRAVVLGKDNPATPARFCRALNAGLRKKASQGRRVTHCLCVLGTLSLFCQGLSAPGNRGGKDLHPATPWLTDNPPQSARRSGKGMKTEMLLRAPSALLLSYTASLFTF